MAKSSSVSTWIDNYGTTHGGAGSAKNISEWQRQKDQEYDEYMAKAHPDPDYIPEGVGTNWDIINAIRENEANAAKLLNGALNSNGSYNNMANSIEDASNNINSATAYNEYARKDSLDWQEYMSNTSHQREVADLQAAGLNPILSANGGANSYNATSSSADMSELTAKASLMNTLINASSAQNIAKINANATKYSSDNAYNAAIKTSPYGSINDLFGFNAADTVKNVQRNIKDYRATLQYEFNKIGRKVKSYFS